MEIKDLLGLNDPIKALIEVISKGIGRIYNPKAIRKEADANAYKTEVEAIANAKKILVEGEAEIELLERAKNRFVYIELIRQANIESIAERSIELIDENKELNGKVDDDWILRFFSKAKDVSNKQLQDLWSRILAKEVESPDSVSLRTLDLLSNLSKKEAEAFHKLSDKISDNNYIITTSEIEIDKKHFNSKDIFLLKEAGIISSVDVYITLEKKSKSIRLGSNIYKVSSKKVLDLISGYRLTNSGVELYNMIKPKFNVEFEKDLIEFWKSKGYYIE